jgi:hypothetical protein
MSAVADVSRISFLLSVLLCRCAENRTADLTCPGIYDGGPGFCDFLTAVDMDFPGLTAFVTDSERLCRADTDCIVVNVCCRDSLAFAPAALSASIIVAARLGATCAPGQLEACGLVPYCGSRAQAACSAQHLCEFCRGPPTGH